jgi:hypothetical protein
MFNGIPFFSFNQLLSTGGGYPDFDISKIYAGGLNDGGGDTFRRITSAGSQDFESDPLGGSIRIADLSISPYNFIYAVNEAGTGTPTYDFAKMDMDGAIEWGLNINGGDSLLGVSWDSNSENVWVSGLSGSGVPYDGTLYKYDSDGNQLYKKLRTGDYFGGCQNDIDGNIYVTSQRSAISKSLYKFDTDGTELWSVDHGAVMWCIATPLDGTYVVAGGTRTSNITWRKYTSAGALVFSKDANGSMGNSRRSLFVDNVNGYIYVTNESTPNLRKYSEDGTLLWSYSMSCSLCRAYTVIPDGGSYIYTSQQQEGMKKWTDANPPVQQWQYDAGADVSIRIMALYPLPYGINQNEWI